MIRFFADKSAISNGKIQLNAEDSAHIRSLRLRPSECFVVCDGEGVDYLCRLGGNAQCTMHNARSASGSFAEIVDSRPSRGEPTVACSVYIALAKGDRLDYAVQKSVELGAFEIIMYPSERCVSLPADISKKAARLQRISLETAKQCGRGRVPEITVVDSFEKAVLRATRTDVPLFFYECEENRRLKEALAGGTALSTFSIMTGPEGGFEQIEAEYAESAGMRIATLGSRILRCETAPIAALAAIMFHTGNY